MTSQQLSPDQSNWLEFAAPSIDPNRWTAVIPAAGKGSRLGASCPKILYPVAGRMILEWLLDFLEPNCSRFVFVLSPSGRDEVCAALDRLIPGKYDVAIQETPKGMGDAVELGLEPVATVNLLIVWGDQVALKRNSVDACLRLHDGPLQPAITCPTVFRREPYIHFDRDNDGRICAIRQARERDEMPPVGESDTGFFCFRREDLLKLMNAYRADTIEEGLATGEYNFLPVIPYAAINGLSVLTPRVMELSETIGINSPEDATIVAEFLTSSYAAHNN